MNRDLTRRIRTVNGITCLKQVMHQDIKVAAKVVQNLDAKFGLWGESQKDAHDADLPIVSKIFHLQLSFKLYCAVMVLASIGSKVRFVICASSMCVYFSLHVNRFK